MIEVVNTDQGWPPFLWFKLIFSHNLAERQWIDSQGEDVVATPVEEGENQGQQGGKINICLLDGICIREFTTFLIKVWQVCLDEKYLRLRPTQRASIIGMEMNWIKMMKFWTKNCNDFSKIVKTL